MSARIAPDTVTSTLSRVALLKPLLFDLHPIDSGNQVEKLIVAARAGLRLAPLAGAGVGQRDRRAGQCATGLVGYRADYDP